MNTLINFKILFSRISKTLYLEITKLSRYMMGRFAC